MWFVYLVESFDGQLYCGITTDPERRIKEHNFSKRGAKWTKAHRPVKLVYLEECKSRSEASKREAQIKKLKKCEKKKLIKSSINKCKS